MPRVDQYRNNHFSDYDSQPSASGTLLFIGILALIILAGLLWAAYSPSDVSSGANSPAAPTMTQPRTPPALPQTPSQPATPTPSQPATPNR